MDGILIIDKPAGITSHDVVAHVRRILKTKRVGHTGTLDPFATGVMVILVGKATRLAQFLDKDEKEYEARLRFGSETDTGDVMGMRNAECGLTSEEIEEKLGSVEWESVFEMFRGEIEQTPPMYSAKKVKGNKLYELARKGIEIEREPVAVTIYELDKVEPPAVAGGLALLKDQVKISVVCSAGTYIRTLAEDIGRAVGLGAHLIELRRTKAGKFSTDDAVTLEELEHSGPKMMPIGAAVSHLRVFELREDRVDKTKNGMSTRDLSEHFTGGETVQMVDPDGELIAIGYFDDAEKVVQPKVVLG